MTDFIFYGCDVTLFRSALRGYHGVLVNHPDIDHPDANEDLEEMLLSGFDGACFSFYFTYVGLVLRSLEWYLSEIVSKMRSCNDMKLCSGYCINASNVRTLIAQINLMLDLNDDD